MKAFICFVILNVIGFIPSLGQSLSKKYIDSWIIKTFSTPRIDSNTVYVLNGHPIDADIIENKLTSYSQSDLIVIDYVDKAIFNENLFICTPPRSIVILATTGNQKRKSIHKNFAKAKNEYKQSEANKQGKDKQPVLIINREHIESLKSQKVLKRLRKADVLGVNIIDKPVSQELYGINGKNGLIMISTK